MTLATASHHIAWAAPVYYVSKGSHFYFFSNPKSRHILETLASGQAAATIYEESSQWQALKGIQMSGKNQCGSSRPGSLSRPWRLCHKISVDEFFF